MIKDVAVKLLIALLGLVTPDVLRDAIDAALDVIEVRVRESATDIDDLLVLPLCATTRRALGIPDNDE